MNGKYCVDTDVLELALKEEIEYVLHNSYDNYETGIDLPDKTKTKIAQHIIDTDYQIWEDLYELVANCIDKELKDRLNYLRSLDNCTTLDPRGEEYQELDILNAWERGDY